MPRIVLSHGLIAGAILSAMMLATVPFQEQIGFEYGAIVGYTTMVVAFLMVYFGVRSYRDTVAGGQVSFGRALGVGLLISLVATACYVATWEVVWRAFMPDFGAKYTAYALARARQSGATEAQLATQAAEMAAFWSSYESPLVRIPATALEPLPVALVFTLVTAGIVSRNRNQEPGNRN